MDRVKSLIVLVSCLTSVFLSVFAIIQVNHYVEHRRINNQTNELLDRVEGILTNEQYAEAFSSQESLPAIDLLLAATEDIEVTIGSPDTDNSEASLESAEDKIDEAERILDELSANEF